MANANSDFVVKNGLVVNTSFSANSSSITGNNLVANSSGVYHSGIINAASHTVGTSTIANSTGVYTGVVNAASYTVGTSTIANSTGVYTGVVNATTHSVGTSFIANTLQVTISGIPLSANGSNGSQAYVLTSNGSTGSPYWASPGYVNVSAQFAWVNTHTFSAPVVFANTIAANGSANVGTAGYVLTSGGAGANVYWAAAAGGVTATNGIIAMGNQVTTNYSISSGNNGFSVGPVTVSAAVTVATGSRWLIL